MKFVGALAKFLWDFFVGDTPELFAGSLAVVTFGWLAHQWLGSTNSAYLLPAAVSAVMAWSLTRASRR